MAVTLRQPGSVNTPIRRSPTMRYLQNGGAASSSSSKITKAGVDWLKVAFAAPDFPILTPCGIPDQYTGRTLIHQDRLVTSIAVPTDDYFIVVPPIPGYSHFIPDSALPQATIYTGVHYDSFVGLYGPSKLHNSDTVTAFRYMSQLAELVPTTNNMTWKGSISVYKVPLKSTMSNYLAKVTLPGATPVTGDMAVTNRDIVGLKGIIARNSDQYTAPSNLGCFTAAHQNNNDFPFTPTQEGYESMPTLTNAGAVPVACYGAMRGAGASGLPGFGQLDTIVIRIQGGKDNTFVLKTWAALELQIQNSSPLYQYTIQSPLYDPAALAAYSAMVRASPNAVSYYENAGFWDFIKRTIRTVSGSLAMLPGPYGQVAGGINQIMNGLFK